MNEDEFFQLIRETASDSVIETAKVQQSLDGKVSPVVLMVFPMNVAQTILAMTIEFFIQLQKGVDLSPDQTSDNIYEIKKKISEAIKPIMAEHSGMIVVHKRLDTEEKGESHGQV
jgi:hypothetical protein